MNGIVLSTDLFSIYLFIEVAALASYGLVSFGRKQEELEGALKYLMLSAVASAFILLGIIILFALTGSVSFINVSMSLKTVNTGAFTLFCISLFIAGFGMKSALVPFHTWLPDAYSASPATLPALSSGLLIKIAGVYALIRIIVNVLGITPAISAILMYLGIISMIAGALLALGQNNIRRMLGYSSISQMGYIMLGFATGTPIGILGGLFHLINHGIFKSLLFLNAGTIESVTGTKQLDKMQGIGNRMPITAITSTIGALSTAGIPPLNGFWSKLFIIIALVQSGWKITAVLAVLASILTLWYFLILQRKTFFCSGSDVWNNVKEPSFWMSFSVIILALLCIISGIFYPVFITGWLNPAANVFSAGTGFLAQVLK